MRPFALPPSLALAAWLAVAPEAAAQARPAAEGVTLTLRPPSAPHDDHPEVLVRIPPGYSHNTPTNVVVFLHGWGGCVSVVAGSRDAPCRPGGRVRHAMRAVEEFDRAGVDAVLVVPQLAFDRASSAPGRMGEPGGFRALLRDVLASLPVARSLDDLGRVVVVGHSGAWLPAERIAEHGGVEVHQFVFFDALYRSLPAVTRWASERGDRRLVVVYTPDQGTGGASVRLGRAAVEGAPPEARAAQLTLARGAPRSPAAFASRVTVRSTSVPHGRIPPAYLAPVLMASGLPRVASR